jgi:CBS domain-containing protein
VAIVASAERKRAVLDAALRGVRVAEAMSGPVVTGPDWLTVDRFIDEIAAAQAGHSVLPLVLPLLDFEGRPSGVVQLRRLAAVPPARRAEVRVRDVAAPISRCTVAAPEEAMEDVLDRIGSTVGSGLPILVMDGARSAGIITARDIARLVRRHILDRDGPGTGGLRSRSTKSLTCSGSSRTRRSSAVAWADPSARRRFPGRCRGRTPAGAGLIGPGVMLAGQRWRNNQEIG